jgi:ribosome-associated toxin RatA of RatAB toxin-antitoxin module
MADQTTSSIEVAAPVDAVMAVIADVEAYPDWVTGIRSAEVLSRFDDGRVEQARFTVDSGPIKDTYVLEYTWDDDTAVSWSLVEAELLTAMDGEYRLTGESGVTSVAYALSVGLKIPMIGMIKRRAEKVIVDTALKGLKERVESGAGGGK